MSRDGWKNKERKNLTDEGDVISDKNETERRGNPVRSRLCHVWIHSCLCSNIHSFNHCYICVNIKASTPPPSVQIQRFTHFNAEEHSSLQALQRLHRTHPLSQVQRQEAGDRKRDWPQRNAALTEEGWDDGEQKEQSRGGSQEELGCDLEMKIYESQDLLVSLGKL